jgi:hypothetical protein
MGSFPLDRQTARNVSQAPCHSYVADKPSVSGLGQADECTLCGRRGVNLRTATYLGSRRYFAQL